MALKTYNIHQLPDSELSCLRCETLMKSAGELVLREGESKALPRLHDSIHNTVQFDALICPQCGKTELFL
ncbi:MAG: hypothetical protein ACI835_002748 [Planctomycetota bacterium]|jgi:hypothetical protein